MRVLWPHNFDPSVPNAGVFMYTAREALLKLGVEPVLLPLGNLRSPAGIARARKELRLAASHMDLVHAQFGSACAYLTSQLEDIPLLVSLRGSDWTPAYSDSRRWRFHGRLATRLTRRSIDSFSTVIVMSWRMAGEVQGEFPEARVVVLPDPVDLDLFQPRSASSARAQLALDPEPKYVLFTSLHRNNPLKRPELAHEAIRLVKARLPNVRLLEATGYPHQAMPALVAAADVVLCTSVAEGWPNAVKEALACNVPFVATDVSDLRIIADVDESCHVVPPHPQAIADALLATLTSNRDPQLRGLLSQMTPDFYAQETVALYRSLLNG